MTLQFKDSFWSADFISTVGYEVLTQRLNDGRRTCKDLEECLKLRALAEEKYGKELVSIARKAGGLSEICTLRASFDELKKQLENVGKQHMHLSMVLREEMKKLELFREHQKEQRRKLEDVMEKVQKTKVSLYKKTIDSKKSYELRCRDADEAEQNAEKMAPTATPKLTEKVKIKSMQSREEADKAEKVYLANVEQLDKIHQEWTATFTKTCEIFQQQEEDRINTLRNGLWVHSNHLSTQSVHDDDCYELLRTVLEKCNAAEDNNAFVEMKRTGSTPPANIGFQNYYHDDGNPDKLGSSRFGGVMKRVSDLIQCTGAALKLQLNEPGPTQTIAEISDAIYASIPEHPRQDSEEFKVVYDYTAQGEDELSVSAGETVLVMQRGEDGWWTVQSNGQTGLVPGSYLSLE